MTRLTVADYFRMIEGDQPMSRQEILQAAIEKNKKYLENKDAITYHNRIEQYRTEIALLDLVEADAGTADDPDVPPALSKDPSVALVQILSATGNPVTFDAEGATISIDPSGVIAAATDQQQRELALLGFFGQPGTNANVDYSLFEQFYDGEVGGNWVPKEPYANTGTWAGYLAGQ